MNKIETKSGNDFCVVLEKVGNQPLMTIKILREITGLGLADTKNMVDHAPITVISGLESDKALKLKEQLEAIGNVISVPGMETEAITENPISEKKATANTDEHIPSDFEKALAKVYEIVGREGFMNGDRVYNLLGDLVPKLEKERRRIKMAYTSNAVDVLMWESDQAFAVNEAVKRLVDYSDMSESVAKATILAIYEVLK